jgi:hypothetical protein
VSTWTIERDTKVEAKGGKNRTSSKEKIKKTHTHARAREEKLLVCALHFSFYGITKCRGRLSTPKLDDGDGGTITIITFFSLDSQQKFDNTNSIQNQAQTVLTMVMVGLVILHQQCCFFPR